MSDWTIEKIGHERELERQLVQFGLATKTAQDTATRFHACANALASQRDQEVNPVGLHFVPGRIEVLGKHTDYTGGRTVVAAAERGFCSVFAPRNDATIRITDEPSNETIEFPIDPALQIELGRWSNYPMTVARRVARNFGPHLQGADLVFSSNLPAAAGMSSSSAMIVMVFLALGEINQLSNHPEFQNNIANKEDLAGYLGTIENGQNFGTLIGDRGVGTFGGSEDHTAILCSRPHSLAQYSYCPVRWERHISVPSDFLFAIGVSGVVAEKTGAAMEDYNRAARRAATVTDIWNDATSRDDPHLAAAAHSSPNAVDLLRQLIDTTQHVEFDNQCLRSRLDQFIAESSEIIPNLPDRLVSSSMDRFGELSDRSQDFGHRLLGNQIPETVVLAQSARKLKAKAASAFGAGFGGSVWALVHQSDAGQFIGRWRQEYVRSFPQHRDTADFFTTAPGPPAFSLSEPIPFT